MIVEMNNGCGCRPADVDHEHDDVTSFVFREDRPLDLERVEDFLSFDCSCHFLVARRHLRASPLFLGRPRCKLRQGHPCCRIEGFVAEQLRVVELAQRGVKGTHPGLVGQ